MPATHHELLGRSEELRVLDVAIDESRREGRIVLVEGEGGIGKTRLVEEASARAQTAGFVVLRGICEELEHGRPFAPLEQALAAQIRLADGDTYAGVEAVLEQLETLTVQAPVLLVLEDLHWCDHATLRALLAVGRRMAHLRLALVGTMRPTPRHRDLERLLERLPQDALRRLVLRPLDEQSVLSLATELGGAPPASRLAAQLAGTGGNPLFVVELMQALRDEGGVEVVDGHAELRTSRLPATLARTILRRLSFVPDETLEVLRIASVLGSSFPPAHLSAVMNRPVVDLLASLREAIAAALLAERGDRLAFRHDLIREAIYSDLPEALRAALHLEVSKALTTAGAPSEVVAEHVALGTTAGDAEGIEWMRRTANELRYRAPHTAIRLLERALDLADESDPARDAIAAGLLLPLELAGRRADAWRLGEEILARDPSPDVEYIARSSIAYSQLAGGQPAKAIDHYRVVTSDRFATLLTEPDRDRHPIDLGNFACSLFLTGDLEGAERESARAVKMALDVDDDLAKILAEFPRSWLARARGDPVAAIEIATRLVRIAERSASAHAGNVWPHWELGHALIDADGVQEAEQVLQTGLRIATRQGRGSQVPMYHFVLARIRLLVGAWDEAAAEVDAALAAMEDIAGVQRGDNPMFAAAIRGSIAVRRGELAVAASLLSGLESRARPGLDLALAAGGLLAEAEGDERVALVLLGEAWDELQNWQYFWDWRSLGTEVVRLALANGDRTRAAAVTGVCEEGARRAPGASTAAGAALRCRGLLEDDPGILAEAVDAYRRGPRPLDLALACEDTAVRLGARGQRSEAAALFEEALGIYTRLGAGRDAARASSAMRKAGIRRGTRGPRARPKTGWLSLTPTEQKTVALVAEGLTNRQIADRLFVSRHTVESHLRNVFVKLGVSSRTELAAMAARRGVPPPSAEID